MPDRRLRRWAVLLPALLGGCSFAPDYHPPKTEPVAAFKESGLWQPAQPADTTIAADWWRQFGDPTLDQLETQVASSNPTLAAALARYDQARGFLTQTRAATLPDVGVTADLSRNRQSDDRPLRSDAQPTYYGAHTLEAQFGFELDLWGRIRNMVAAGKAEVMASADDLAEIRLSLQTELARQYFALRGYDRQIAVLTQTVDAFAQADHLTRRRVSGGVASELDATRSGTLLAEARAQLADVQSQRAQTEHGIATLIGENPSRFTLAAAQIDLQRPQVPTALPSTLLERRPDIAAAERRMFSANAQIGVARAAFFPAIRLGGGIGYQGTALSSLITAPNTLWSAGVSSLLPLFDGGRRRGSLAVARARWTETTASYRGKVLQAFQEVEDNLATLRYLQTQLDAEQDAVRQAAAGESLSLSKYTKGAAIYLDVVTAQTTALRTRLTLISLETRNLQASARLMTALGGGWTRSRPS
ncbi:efflux transporter outer membrane subunit [Sphingomonas sp. AP4-R1]|uniref:efflux transporter outer membrane subunit n=1 Tax=Sphingomonas sp. AP4-R1 TaxID=2735134 RepID=UPI00149378BC|nr:efflux transporter outer membrane subunit [Sphingomonas sp. AP4-R1]QJU57353.1 efflux transporter outer membrane subunit [Sphingomonas sp. AP4-R1]